MPQIEQKEKVTKEVKGINFKRKVHMIIKGETHSISVMNEEITQKDKTDGRGGEQVDEKVI